MTAAPNTAPTIDRAVRLEPEMEQCLQDLQAATGQDRSAMIRERPQRRQRLNPRLQDRRAERR